MAVTPTPPHAFPNTMHHIPALRPKSRSQPCLCILSYPFQRVSYQLCFFYFFFTFFPVFPIFLSILHVQKDWRFWKRILSLSLCLGTTINDLFILSLTQNLGYLKSQLNPWAWITTGNIQSNLQGSSMWHRISESGQNPPNHSEASPLFPSQNMRELSKCWKQRTALGSFMSGDERIR